ncbi:MAG: bifunctional hydroxymethylpyrimidine kinase/phosphomethylpyrimidine kinase [Acidobacteriota bacterium]
MRTALTIAGSDSSGGAGIQADLRTFTAHGVHGTSAITAITAQNTLGVTAVLALPPELVVAQIDAVIADLGADAVKIGMLANAGIAAAVAQALARHRLSPVVLDPVMVAKGGASLLDDAAIGVLRSRLFPLATVVTANIPEAEALTGLRVTDVSSARRAAALMVEAGARAAIVKGGHLTGDAVDVLFDGITFTEFASPRIATRHTHGTGCTFASAIAAQLALGASLLDAVGSSKIYVTRAIEHAPGLGHGHGPLGLGT